MEEPEPSVELIFNTKKKAETHNVNKPAVEVRNFVNNMNDYKVTRRGTEEAIAKSQQVPLTRLTAPRVALWVPPEFLEHSFPHSSVFLKAAIKMKDEVVQATWTRNAQKRVDDPTMHTGVLGSAMLCFKAFLITNSHTDLVLCSGIVDSCCAAAPTHPDNVTFLRGQAGIYAMGAVAAHFRGDSIRRDFFLEHCSRIAERRVLSVGPADEGGGLFVRSVVHQPLLRPRDCPVVHDGAHRGRRVGVRAIPRHPGVSAHVSLEVATLLGSFPGVGRYRPEQDHIDIQNTLRYMMCNHYFCGNYCISVEDGRGDCLVHWCHGALGITITLCKAIEMYPQSSEWQSTAKAASELVWERGLLRQVGLCHGISRNAYIFLALHWVLNANKKQLFRARQFVGWIYKHGKRLLATGEMHGGDHRHSLFEGLVGLACLWFDVARPNLSFFPGYEIN